MSSVHEEPSKVEIDYVPTKATGTASITVILFCCSNCFSQAQSVYSVCVKLCVMQYTHSSFTGKKGPLFQKRFLCISGRFSR
uniref:Uncharacterized protein n=1 Tax=Arundo donax TaxID=35708 RepID=A0A0A9A6R4_ARUDO